MRLNGRWETAKLRRLQARRERLGLSPDPLSRLRKMHNELERIERDRQGCKQPHHHQHPPLIGVIDPFGRS